MSSTTNEPDELRSSVEALVESFVAEVVRGMRGNICINGMDVLPASQAGEGNGGGERGMGNGGDMGGIGAGLCIVSDSPAFLEPLRAPSRP